MLEIKDENIDKMELQKDVNVFEQVIYEAYPNCPKCGLDIETLEVKKDKWYILQCPRCGNKFEVKLRS